MGDAGAVTFVVGGQPVPQPRPRFVRAGRFVRTYPHDNGIVAYREAVALMARGAGLQPHSGQVRVDMDFIFARPPSHWTKTGLAKSAPPFLGKPDGDNLQKGVLDAMIGVAYEDDDQVASWGGSKRYAERGEPARTIITVTRLG